MLKKVVYKYTHVCSMVVPDTCPTNDVFEMFDWLNINGIDESNTVIKQNRKDYEIIHVRGFF